MAKKISRKLHAQEKDGGPHIRANIYHEGKIIAFFGIRRGSNTGHDHIPGQLSCNMHFCKELANCTKSRKDWINHMVKEEYI